MFEKNMRLAYLLDFYLDTLDGHSASIMKAYYEDDLSLAEIAQEESISRQGIRHIIKKSEEHILKLEEKLGLAKRYEELHSAAEDLKKASLKIKETDPNHEAAQIIDSVVLTILNKGV